MNYLASYILYMERQGEMLVLMAEPIRVGLKCSVTTIGHEGWYNKNNKRPYFAHTNMLSYMTPNDDWNVFGVNNPLGMRPADASSSSRLT
jgi:hypothetical protein